MRLYYSPQTRSGRTFWLLEEIGAPYDTTKLEGDSRRGDEHRQRHPLGRVPVIEEEGGYVFESGAIALHLADLHPEAGLIGPAGSHQRALAYQWAFFAVTELEPRSGQIRMNRESNPEAAAAASEQWRAAAQAVEDALGDGEYLIDGSFSVADVILGAVIAAGKRFDLLEGLPRVAAYIDRLESRPAYVQGMEKAGQ
jgi:glutathione S-transferase